MRYLKLYELFKVNWESSDVIKSSDNTDNNREQTLREICLELEDIGYSIIINRHNLAKTSISSLIINKKDKDGVGINKLSWDVIKEYMLRIKEYLGDDFNKFHYLNDSWQWRHIELDENTSFKKNENLRAFAIEYRYISNETF